MSPKGDFFYAKNSLTTKEKKLKRLTRQEALGVMFADSIIESAHQTYNASRGKAIIKACVRRLQERIGEIQPKKADPKYREARYAKNKAKEIL